MNREYLTGFSKRKKERQTLVRNKAIEREREEKNEARRAVSCMFSFWSCCCCGCGFVSSAQRATSAEQQLSAAAPKRTGWAAQRREIICTFSALVQSVGSVQIDCLTCACFKRHLEPLRWVLFRLRTAR